MFARLSAICLGLIASVSAVTFSYDESINGDLSDNYLEPNFLYVGAGSSTIKGTIGGGDIDLFTLVVADGFTLNSIVLLNYLTQDPNSQDNVSFILSQPMAILSAAPSNEDPYPGGAIGYVGFGDWAEGREILRFLTAGPPYDFAEELDAGSYAFWINETGSTAQYDFQFTVAAVPEPSALVVLCAVFPTLLWRRNKIC